MRKSMKEGVSKASEDTTCSHAEYSKDNSDAQSWVPESTQQLLHTSESETSSTSHSSASDFDEILRLCKGYMFYQLKLVLGLKDKLHLHPRILQRQISLRPNPYPKLYPYMPCFNPVTIKIVAFG